MAKTYIDTIKYLIYANIEINGLVEKPDVVGAIFGQTEGLLGDELDLRELQKNGRIGRIEVDLQVRGGRSIGKITLPSSLDMVETSILAAALETVDRVGPCEAKIAVEKIEDTRSLKRKNVVERAKTLLKALVSEEIPESKEISELVRQEVKIAEITEYGPEKLPSGPGINTYENIIVVEGRADVLNLLRNGINNVIAIGGANVPESIIKLSREKEITVFLDGDRGGDIILRELLQAADIDYIVRAPKGKEVEELTRKEIIKCLRNRIPVEQETVREIRGDERRDLRFRNDKNSRRFEPKRVGQPEEQPSETTKIEGIPPELTRSLEELETTLRARIYDNNLALMREVPVRDLVKELSEIESAYAVVLDGIATQRLVDLAEEKGVKIMLAVRRGNIFRQPENMIVSTRENANSAQEEMKNE
ncbi:MAG: DNA primase DnaG [Candidatus Micrarchaeia archaeon]